MNPTKLQKKYDTSPNVYISLFAWGKTMSFQWVWGEKLRERGKGRREWEKGKEGSVKGEEGGEKGKGRREKGIEGGEKGEERSGKMEENICIFRKTKI